MLALLQFDLVFRSTYEQPDPKPHREEQNIHERKRCSKLYGHAGAPC
jgi:hypothetical protein